MLTSDELADVRANVFQRELPWARRAWENTLSKANGLLNYGAHPTRPGDLAGGNWFDVLYHPGLLDGSAAYTLAAAYAVGGTAAHAQQAKAICLAWARTYRPVPSMDKIGHMVAEPVGPVIKLCMAYELTRPVFTPPERAEFRSWAAQFVRRAMTNADFARDKPWVPDVTYGEDRTNVASYGNAATWQRAMAVWAAAVVDRATLNSTLEWNLRHRTAAGYEYGWDDLLEGLIIDGTGGEVSDGRYRVSVSYGHFAWVPLVLIADVARRARHRADLFRYRTRKNRYTLFTPVSYYARFATSETIPDHLEKTKFGGAAWPAAASRWRALYEVLYRNAEQPLHLEQLRRAVGYGGAKRRGDNYDIYVVGHGALFGRGPKGPKPAKTASRS